MKPILHGFSVPYHPLSVYMIHQAYPVERERDVLSGHSAIPVWVVSVHSEMRSLQMLSLSACFPPSVVEAKREREREEEDVWVVMGRTGYRWKSTEFCHMERFRRDRNKAKEASEMIAGRKTEEC